MIISFSVFREKIESGEKTQTIRRYSDFQFKRFTNATKYQLYWGNPRNGGQLIKEVEKAENPFIIVFNNSDHELNINILPRNGMKKAYDPNILLDFAKMDGFNSSREMFDWFYSHYGKDMYQKRFMVLRWKP